MRRTPTETVHQLGEPCIRWRPRGLALVLGPFNFPLHLVHGLVVPALAMGNTVLVKFSEHCPALAERYAAAIEVAGLQQVVGIVQGGVTTANHALLHPAIRTVAAVGGIAMGRSLQQALQARPEVVLALEMGGVNPALVCADAVQEKVVPLLAEGAWKQSGQRCTATRIVHVPRQLCTAYAAALTDALAQWQPGAIGPLIHERAKRRFMATMRARPKGLALLAGQLEDLHPGAMVEPVLLRLDDPAVRSDPVYREEHFGPYLIIDPYDSEADAVARMAANPYRLASAVFTQDHARFASIATQLPYGQVNHNRPTAGARSDQPFGGCGLSGNGRPAAIAATAIFADETVWW